jgi:hypothetical protein
MNPDDPVERLFSGAKERRALRLLGVRTFERVKKGLPAAALLLVLAFAALLPSAVQAQDTPPAPPRVARSPAILFTPAALERVAERLKDTRKGTLGRSYAEIAERIRKQSRGQRIDTGRFPAEEPKHFGDTKYAADRLRVFVRRAGVLRHVFNDDRHAGAVRELLLKAAGWKRWGQRDLAVAAILTATALGYDWFHDFFSAEERQKLRDAMVSRGIERILGYVDDKSAGSPMRDGASPNHMAANAAALGFAAFARPDEVRADLWLDVAVERMRRSLRCAGGPGGGPVEGLGYGMTEVIFAWDFLPALKEIRGIDLAAESKWLRRFPLYVAYALGPRRKLANFNDTFLSAGGADAGVLAWIASQFPDMREGRVAQCLARDLLGERLDPFAIFHVDNAVEPLERSGLPLVGVFPDVGQVFVRSDWTEAGMQFASRAQRPSLDGTRAHVHFDAGHFIINWGGDILLADPGYAVQRFLIGMTKDLDEKLGGTPFAYVNEFTLRASGHNTILFDRGLTQFTLNSRLVRALVPDESLPAIYVEMEFGDTYRTTHRSRKRLFRTVRRRILGFLPHALLVHDHVRSERGEKPRSMQVLFHSRWRDKKAIGPEPLVTVSGSQATVSLLDGKHTLRILAVGEMPARLMCIPHPHVKQAGRFLIGESAPAVDHDVFHVLLPGDGAANAGCTDVSEKGKTTSVLVSVGDERYILSFSARGDVTSFPGHGEGVALLEWNRGGKKRAFLVPKGD